MRGSGAVSRSAPPPSAPAAAAPGAAQRLRAACDEATARAVVPVTGGLAVLYALATVIHLLAPTAQPSALLAAATALTAVLLGAVAVRFARRPAPPALAGPLSGLVALIVLANVFLFAVLHADPDDSLYFAVTLVAAGVFVLSLAWLVVVLVAASVAWLVLMGLVVVPVAWLPRALFGVGMLCVAVALRSARVRAIESELRLLEEAERRREEAERNLAANLAAQRAKEHVQEDLRALIANNPDGMLVVRDGVVVAANASIAAVLRRPDASDLEGRALADLVAPEDRESIAAICAPDGARPRRVECAFLRPDGERVMLELALSRTIAYRDEPALLLTLRDVTGRHRALQARVLLADRLIAVGTLAAGVAHEVNNPLAATLANLSIAEAEARRLRESFRTDLPELLAEARAGAERVKTIIRDLRLFARAGDPRPAPLAVGPVLESVARLAGPEIRPRARLDLDLQPVPPTLADPASLAQVFLNLLQNAAKAVPEGDATAQVIAVRTRTTADGAVQVEVEDTGCGMPPEVRRRVFEPFFTTRPVGQGMGLGLSYCHSVVTALGGTITIDTEPGRGTTVSVTLPPAARPAEPVTAEPTAGGPERPAEPAGGLVRRRLTVLVIDDEPPVRTVLRRVLRDHEVVEAHDGHEAIAAIERQPFDLILCDVMMPRVPGSEVYERARTLRPGQERRIIFMTGGTCSREMATFLDRVDRPVVTKPFDLPALRSLIDSVVDPAEL